MATGITVGAALLMLAAWRSRFIPVSSSALPRGADLPFEHLAYVVPRHASLGLTPARPAAGPPSPAEPERRAASPRRELVTMPHGIGVDSRTAAATPPSTAPTASDAEDQWVRRALFLYHGPDSAAARETTTGTSYSSEASVGALSREVTVGFPRGRSEPVRFDSALRAMHDDLVAGLAAGAFDSPALAQAQRDEQLRARARAAIAARSAGVPISPGMVAGGKIAVPLPFGGPSRAQRERERAVNAVTVKILARVRQRLDSVAAARRARSMDSLAYLADSLRRDTVQRP